MAIEKGFGSPYFRVFYGDTELSDICESLDFAMDEENDDVCEITVKVNKPADTGEKWFQPKAVLKIIWGYIQGPVSNIGKVYVQDVTWKYGNDIVGTIQCTEKAVSMKFTDSQEVHKGSAIGLVNKIASKHNLVPKIVIDSEYTKHEDIVIPTGDKPGEDLNSFLKRNYVAAQKQGKTHSVTQGEYSVALQRQQGRDIRQDNMSAGRKNFKPLDPYTPEQIAKANADFAKWGVSKRPLNEAERREVEQNVIGPMSKRNYVVPQAGRSDKEILKRVLAKMPMGPFLVESHGDELIIRRRNLNKKPYRAYTWGGTFGELVEFKPLSRRRSTRSNATNRAFTNFNPLAKSVYAGNANGTTDQANRLFRYQEQLKYYGRLVASGAGGKTLDVKPIQIQGISKTPVDYTIVNQTKNGKPTSVTLNRTNQDGTNIQKNIIVAPPFTVRQHFEALKKGAEAYNEEQRNLHYDPTAANPEDAYNGAQNARRSSELKMNPATAKVWGDPNLEVGMVLTFLGVGAKYTGNYYITKVKHVINNSGYMTDLEMVAGGHGIKANEDYEDVTNLGVEVNKQIGPDKGTKKNKPVKVKTNPKK